MTRLADFLDKLIDRIGRITGWCAFALVCVMAFNVLLRYLFRKGSVAMQELEWHLMAPICLLGLSYALLHDGHVKVDILYGRFKPQTRRFIDLVSMLLVCLVVGLLIYLSIPYVEQSYRIGEKSPDPGGLTHRWILKALLPLGFTLLLIQSFAALLRAVIAFRDPAAPPIK
jgi:TRAP-type mannitol/chloroaromatic compound transport system permease small subunit